MKERTRDFALVGVVQRLAQCTDAQGIVTVLARAARQLIGSDGVTVIMRDGNRCRYVEEDAIGALWKGRDFALDDCVSGLCISRGEPLVIPDIRADERVPQALYESTFVRALAMIPILRDEPCGALGVYWATEHRATALEMAALRAIADSAALALANVQLLEKLRRDNERKDAILGSLAHELGETLGPMRTSLHLRQAAEGGCSDARLVQVFAEQLARQAQLVDLLVDGSQLLAGHARLQPRLLDLRHVVRAAVESRRQAAQLAELSLTLAMPAVPICVRGEERRIRQALLQVIDNSLRCTPPEGEVRVAIGLEGDCACLRVRDTGIGIAPDALPHLFEPFFKPRHEPARSVAGLGLGLSMVAGIMQLHDGDVHIDSRGAGEGTEVVMRFPLAGPQRHERGADASPREAARG